MAELTARQAQVLALIKEYMERMGVPPTRVELAQQLGFKSPNAAEDHLRALERKGAIEMVPGTSRGIRLVSVELGLPVVGKVAAGSPILAVEHIDDHYRIAPEIFQPRADYFLRVQGMSMRDAGIFNGDLLAVHRTQEARNGQVIVARVDDEVTVKRFERQGKTVLLHPENAEFQTLHVDTRVQSFVIEGRAVGVLRNGKRL
ncbi:MAG: transcriptional repressor LexA [Gammaproteobacteria bacterium]|nr:transcriptional repressor LexA [Gammaproteobacteria bacterium]